MAETKKTTVAKKETVKKTVKQEVATEKKVAKVVKAKAAPKAVKEPATEKKVAKVEEVKKPIVTEAKAKALNVKITPRKVRLVVDLVRNKDCDEALEILFNTNKEGSKFVYKLIQSAMANATNNYNMNEDKLYVASIMASDSVKMRRFLPRAKGSASGMVKRFCNIFVTVKERI